MQLNVNGQIRNIDVEPNMPLLWAIRESLGLTGTKYGCGVAQCGACTVHLDGKAVKSCNVLALQAEGAHVRYGPDRHARSPEDVARALRKDVAEAVRQAAQRRRRRP